MPVRWGQRKRDAAQSKWREREREKRDRLGLFGGVDKKKEVPYNCHERDEEGEEDGGEGGPFAGHVTDGDEEDEDKEARNRDRKAKTEQNLFDIIGYSSDKNSSICPFSCT